MKDTQRRQDLADLVERRRQELSERTDISQRMRELSQSSSRNPIGRKRIKRSSLLTMVIGSLAVVALLTCVASAVAVTAGGLWFQTQLNTPDTTVQQFFSSLHQQDYGDAYKLFASSARAHLSESAFADQYGSYDQIDGIVDSYPVIKTTASTSSAVVTVAVVRRGNAAVGQIEVIQLTRNNGAWQIVGITVTGTMQMPTPTA